MSGRIPEELSAQTAIRAAPSQSGLLLDAPADQWLGVVEAVTGERTHADAVAAEPCTVVALDHRLQREIGDRFEAFDARLAELATRALRTRMFRRSLAGLFAGGEPALLAELIDCATEVLLPRGAYLLREGESSDAWYVLTSGRLGVLTTTRDGPRRGADLLPGASIGEIGLITGGARTATVVAERDASLMRIARADFERFADAQPAFSSTSGSSAARPRTSCWCSTPAARTTCGSANACSGPITVCGWPRRRSPTRHGRPRPHGRDCSACSPPTTGRTVCRPARCCCCCIPATPSRHGTRARGWTSVASTVTRTCASAMPPPRVGRHGCWPAADSVSHCRAAAPGASRTSACCARSANSVCRSTASAAPAWARSRRASTRSACRTSRCSP
jgi:CRP-like cAMP-binding protein